MRIAPDKSRPCCRLTWRLASTSLLLLVFLPLSESLAERVPCVETGKFYRNPNRDPDKAWSQRECAKYYLCVDDEVCALHLHLPRYVFTK
jgi:hypothetical protein